MTIWTVGHSNRILEEFITLLKAHRIESVADVRSYPGSRKFPHFNREALHEALAVAGIEYRHIPQLGGRRRASRDSSRHKAWRNEGFRAYAEHMESDEFAEGIARVLETASQRNTAVMCAEALWWRCHRQLIADYLKVRGHRVVHLLHEDKEEEHPYSPPATIRDGELSYETDE